MEVEKGIERKIIIGLITSTEFIEKIRRVWSVKLIQSSMAKRLATWCIDYYDKFEKAPGVHIEEIFMEKLKKGLPNDIAEEIEEDILPDLSDTHAEENINVPYLVEQTLAYFNDVYLRQHGQRIQEFLDAGETEEAEKLANEYQPLVKDTDSGINLSDEKIIPEVEKAFDESYRPVVEYPKQLGAFFNRQLIRGAFVALMASEKRGKSYWLLDMAIRAVRQNRKVAFFQAGDMTEHQQIRRIGIHLCKKSDRDEYCKEMYEPVRDCAYNQINDCNLSIRECEFGVFEGKTVDEVRTEITKSELIEAFKDEPDYIPCHNCKKYTYKSWGAVWVRKVSASNALQVKEATNAFSEFFVKNKRQFMLSSHANGTLSLKEIKALLNQWKRYEGFEPDLIIIDYADLLVPETQEFRHAQNEIWKGLRSLSQQNNEPLVVTATQADANSYEKNRLTLKNFSEDKRKYAHPTAMYGLNQDPHGREKEIGVMRINEMVIREGYFDSNREVYALQNLSRGLPFISSFW